MKITLLLITVLCLAAGCQTVGYAFRDKNDPKPERDWDEKLDKWKLQNAADRYASGMMGLYEYNQVRKKYGLRPIR